MDETRCKVGRKANQKGPYVNNEHSYTLPSPGLPRQTQVKSGMGPVSQVLPPDTSRDAKSAKLIPAFFGGEMGWALQDENVSFNCWVSHC